MNFFEVIKPKNPILPGTEVIFVADIFVEEYSGGAELTSEALIKSSPYKIQKVHSKEVTKSMVEQNRDKTWIFGNISMLNPAVVPAIMGSCKYVILEYDYKFCAHRSIEKHLSIEKKQCDCHEKPIGDLISTFFANSNGIFWMSEIQQEIYRKRFPSLEDANQFVLSSVFDEEFFMSLKILREKYENYQRSEWLVLKSNSWIKGTDSAVEYCKNNSLPFREISGLSYDALLEELAKAKGFVFLPPGGDTCPRIVIEAKLLGCELVLNDNVQHAKEIWFDTDDLEEIEQYLYASREMFWNYIKHEVIEKVPTLSGYTTTYNCVSQKYPFEQCILSMLEFCDEVVVLDGGSRDGTFEKLVKIQEEQLFSSGNEPSRGPIDHAIEENNKKSRLKIYTENLDWSNPRFALYDGMQKAKARSYCTGDFCWQMDSDEVVHENDYAKIRDLMNKFPRGINLVSLPVIEYWGGPDKVRMDVTPWKWRMSRNLKSITHGVPVTHRRVLEDGTMVALSGTDGCDMIHSRTGEPIPFIGFYTKEADEVRSRALQGDKNSLEEYKNWISQVADAIPGVHHFSWYDLERKIKTYKNYWTRHWLSLYGEAPEDTAENNMFFDVPWSEVTDEMISERAKELSQIGGWIFHKKWKGQRTPSMKLSMGIPKVMKEFIKDGR